MYTYKLRLAHALHTHPQHKHIHKQCTPTRNTQAQHCQHTHTFMCQLCCRSIAIVMMMQAKFQAHLQSQKKA